MISMVWFKIRTEAWAKSLKYSSYKTNNPQWILVLSYLEHFQKLKSDEFFRYIATCIDIFIIPPLFYCIYKLK